MSIEKTGNLGLVGKVSQTVPKKQEEQQKSPSVSNKTILAGGAAAVAAIAIALIAIKRKKVKTEVVQQEVKNVITDVKAFKEAGNKFLKGKALTAEGKNFSGTIENINKKDVKYSMEYLEGVLQKSTKLEGEKTSEKIYSYLADGKLSEISLKDEMGAKNIFKRVVDSEKGIESVKTAHGSYVKDINAQKVLEVTDKTGYNTKFFYTKDGTLKYKKTEFLHGQDIDDKRFTGVTAYKPDGKTIEKQVTDSSIRFFEDGKEQSTSYFSKSGGDTYYVGDTKKQFRYQAVNPEYNPKDFGMDSEKFKIFERAPLDGSNENGLRMTATDYKNTGDPIKHRITKFVHTTTSGKKVTVEMEKGTDIITINRISKSPTVFNKKTQKFEQLGNLSEKEAKEILEGSAKDYKALLSDYREYLHFNNMQQQILKDVKQ